MSFPLWRYGAFAFAIAVMGCLAAANVAWAWSLDDGLYRYVMIGVSCAADVGAVVAFLAMRHYFSEGDPLSVIAAFSIWLLCGGAEIAGAETWFKANAFSVSSPLTKAGEEKNVALMDLSREEKNLSDIRKSLTAERRESLRDDLHAREKETLSRIRELQPKTFSTNVPPVGTQYAGNELYLALALWLLSQAAWRMAVGRAHAHVKPTPLTPVDPLGGFSPEQMETLRAWLALGESTLEIRPATPSHAQKKPVGRIGFAHTPNHAQPTPNQSRPVSPSHAHAQPENQEGNEQIIEILEETTGFSDAQPVGFLVRPTTLGEKPDAQTPYQAPILGELGEGGRNHAQPAPNHAQPPTPKLGIPLRLVENHPTLTAFQITVQDLMAAGKSERQIAETTGKGRHAVRAAKAAIDKHATENCKEGKAPK